MEGTGNNSGGSLHFITKADGGSRAEVMSLDSAGLLTIADDLVIKTGGTIGGANDTDLLTLTSAVLTVAGEVVGTGFTGTLDGVLGGGTPAAASVTTLTTTGNIVIPDGGNIGSASDTNAMSISSIGLVSLSATNAIKLNVGTTAQRPTGAAGLIRYNSTTGGFEGYGAAWGALGGGATGGGGDTVFVENQDDVTTNYSITAGSNALSVGPIIVETGVTVTVPTGQRWLIL